MMVFGLGLPILISAVTLLFPQGLLAGAAVPLFAPFVFVVGFSDIAGVR
jgi:hypothetical protein